MNLVFPGAFRKHRGTNTGGQFLKGSIGSFAREKGSSGGFLSPFES